MVGKNLRNVFTLSLVGGILFVCTLLPSVHETILQVNRSGRVFLNFESQSNLSDWSFTKRIKCPNFSIQEYPNTRETISLKCDIKQPKFVSRTSGFSDDIFEIPFGHKCLKAAIDSSCSDKRPVPNLVHYIWYNRIRMNFVPFLSFMSVVKFIKPCMILLHGPYVPFGPYWDYFIRVFPYIIHVKRNRTINIGGHKLFFEEHSSDVMRIEALRAYGGIYLDWDEIVLRSVDKLRDYDMTMGEETKTQRKMGSQFIMAIPKAGFLELWYRSYFENYKKTWVHNALVVPFELAEKHPSLVHIEENLFCRPEWLDRNKIFYENFDWSENYAIHLFTRAYKRPINETIIKFLNTTLGSVSRHILFGNKELCK